MTTMHAITPSPTPQTPLSWVKVPKPHPAPHEVLLKVQATAVNRADLVQRQGRYTPPPGASPILGLEAAGEIVLMGAEVKPDDVVHPGATVCALLAGGGYAEYVCVPATHLLPLPPGLGVIQAASLPEVFATAWLNLFIEASPAPGDWALIHAAASGVGTAALQLCRAKGVHTIATASAQKLPLCRALGAAVTHDRHTGSFVDAVKSATKGQGVSVILDPVGGPDYIRWGIDSLRLEGTLVLIGLMGGVSAEVSLGKMLLKRLRLAGSTLRSRSDAFKARLLAELRTEVWPLITPDGANQSIHPVIDHVLPITQAEEAHRLLAQNQTTGKVVLTLP